MKALWPNMNFHTIFISWTTIFQEVCTETITKHKKYYFFNDYDSKIACIFCLFRVYQRTNGESETAKFVVVVVIKGL
jgi:hypothetical protein